MVNVSEVLDVQFFLFVSSSSCFEKVDGGFKGPERKTERGELACDGVEDMCVF